MSSDGTRLYIGNISTRAREKDLQDMFERIGRVTRCDFKTGFAFVHYDYSEDAEEAIKRLHGKEINGRRLIVEYGRNNGGGYRGGGGGGYRGGGGHRGGGGGYRGGGGGFRSGGGGGAGGGRGEYRIDVERLSARTSWQDLKDFAREAGRSVMYTDVWTENGKNCGIVEYSRREDYENALKILDDVKLDGKYVRLYPGKGMSGRSRRHSSRSPRSRRSTSRSRSKSRSRSRSRDKRERRSSRSLSPAGNRSRSRSPVPSPRRSPRRSEDRDGDRARSGSRDRNDDLES